jgi:hypothetical protein
VCLIIIRHTELIREDGLARDPDKRRAYNAAWAKAKREANREEHNRRAREWRRANAEKVRENDKRWRENNKDKIKQRYKERSHKNRAYHLRRKYGLSTESISAILEQQRGACPICKKDLGDKTINIHIDHDHRSGKTRGILCRVCNTGIGHFDDNPDLLLAAVAYLQKHSA